MAVAVVNEPTITATIRGMTTLLATYFASYEVLIDAFPLPDDDSQGMRDLMGVTEEAFKDAMRYLGRAEVERIVRGARAGAKAARG